MSCRVSPWVYPVWDSFCLLDLIDNFLFNAGEVFNYNLFKNFLCQTTWMEFLKKKKKKLIPFPFLFFWDPYNSNFGAFDIVPVSLRLSSVLFILFTLFCFSEVISNILSSSSLICSSASDILLLIPFRIFLILVIVLSLYVYSFILLGLC